jgi:putative nucleotidyltransferase with HDIG domain
LKGTDIETIRISVEIHQGAADMAVMPDRVIPVERRSVSTAAVPRLLEDSPHSDTVMIPVKLCNLPPFHAVAKQVLWLKDSPGLDARRITALVSADPALAAEVLFLANSSLFGFPSRIQVLHHAVALLGLERVKALAMTVAMRGLMGKKGKIGSQCWGHSAATAILAGEIAPLLDVSQQAAYTAALLHDIGRLGLLRSYSTECADLLGEEYEDTTDVLQAERDVFQVDHGVAGSWLVGYWSFPGSFVEVCEKHHETPDPKDSPLLQTVKLACRLADALGYPAVRCRRCAGYDEVRSAFPGVKNTLPAEATMRSGVEGKLAALQL